MSIQGLKFKSFRHLFALPSLFGIDKLEDISETEKIADKTVVKEETGWDRVIQMFSPNEFGELSYEMVSAMQITSASIVLGAIYGGVIYSRAAFTEFMRNNQATKFTTHLEAKAKLQEKLMISFGKGAFRWSWRLALFTGSIVTISSAIQVYRNKYGVMEYVAAGGITGALFRFNLGPKAWVSGGLVGAVLGGLAGGTYSGLLKMTGISMAESRYWQYQWKESRDNLVRKGMDKQAQDKELAVLILHNLEKGDAGKDISILDKLDSVNNENSDTKNNTNNEKCNIY